MKIIKVESCDECPRLIRVRDTLGTIYCGVAAQDNLFPDIEDSSTIPDWCPLDDAKEADHDHD